MSFWKWVFYIFRSVSTVKTNSVLPNPGHTTLEYRVQLWNFCIEQASNLISLDLGTKQQTYGVDIRYSRFLVFAGAKFHKVPYGKVYQVCWGRISSCEEAKRKKEKQFHLPCDIEAVGKNIKWESRDGGRKYREGNIDTKKRGGEEYQVVGNFLHPC